MGDLRRWNVTYTKHVKQKRKVYQDGFLEFDGSINKVMLYDECEKLLNNRPLKKDEVVESGETLAFDSYLVDIGDLEGGLKPIIKLEIEEKEQKTTKMTEIHQGQKTTNNPTFVGKGASKSCQSPSGNLIREYRKSALRKYGAVKVLPDITKTTFTGNNGLQSLEETQNCSNAVQTTVKEWNVLYTTQITKKAKKYHDGILRLLLCGSRGRQAILLKEDGTTLTSKLLKLSEDVRAGSTFEMTNYLIEIGEPHKFLEEPKISASQEKSSSLDSNSCSLDTNKLSGKLSVNMPLHSEPKISASSSSLDSNSCSLDTNKLGGKLSVNKPLRSALQILTILKKPSEPGSPLLLKALGTQSHSSQHGESHGITSSEASGGNDGHCPNNNTNSSQLGADNMMAGAQRCEEATISGSSGLTGHTSHDVKKEIFVEIESTTKKGMVMDDIPSFDLGF